MSIPLGKHGDQDRKDFIRSVVKELNMALDGQSMNSDLIVEITEWRADREPGARVGFKPVIQLEYKKT